MFILDKHGQPLQPCHPARARQLLKAGRAVVARRIPMVIRLCDRTVQESTVLGVEVGIDPGSKATGIALFTAHPTDTSDHTSTQPDLARRGIYSIELEHRGEQLHRRMLQRAAYCDVTGVPLNLDHIQPRARGGTDRVSNLTLACVPCNQTKGPRPVTEFLAAHPQRLARVLAQAKTPLRDAAAVNATRWALWRTLTATGLSIHVATGGRTKWNRTRCGLLKSHTLDALCVGWMDTVVRVPGRVLVVTAAGRGSYQRTRTDAYGFPRLRLPRVRQVQGLQTGDLVRAVVPGGKNAGTYSGRVAVRTSGKFNIRTSHGLVQGIHHRHVRLLQRADGYGYTWEEERVSAPA